MKSVRKKVMATLLLFVQYLALPPAMPEMKKRTAFFRGWMMQIFRMFWK